MASIRKRQWFTPNDRKRINPVAKEFARAAGKPDKWGHFSFLKQAADSLDIRPSERWIVAYKDNNGRAFKQFATKKEAESWKITAQHEVKQGTHTRASVSKTVAEVWEQWLEDCEALGLERSTVRERRQHLKHHVSQHLGATKLSELTTPRIHDFDVKLRSTNRS